MHCGSQLYDIETKMLNFFKKIGQLLCNYIQLEYEARVYLVSKTKISNKSLVQVEFIDRFCWVECCCLYRSAS